MPFLKCKSHNTPRSKVIEKASELQGLRALVNKEKLGQYRGSWERNKKHGYGAQLTDSGRLYEGNFTNNYRHEFGTQANMDENKVFQLEYRGNWRLGHYSGYGERQYKDGGYYKGYMKNSKRHGEGQMWYKDGGFYCGTWYRDKKHGDGVFIYPNGNRYEGTFYNDLREGAGRFYHLRTGQLQEGNWFEDMCTSSLMEDLPYRQTSKLPTEIHIPKNEILSDIQKVLSDTSGYSYSFYTIIEEGFKFYSHTDRSSF